MWEKKMAQLTCENAILGYEKTAVTGSINFKLDKGFGVKDGY